MFLSFDTYSSSPNKASPTKRTWTLGNCLIADSNICYYYDCYKYLPREDIQLDGLLAGSIKPEKERQQQLVSFGASESSLLYRWLGMRKTFSKLIAKKEYDLNSFSFCPLHISYFK